MTVAELLSRDRFAASLGARLVVDDEDRLTLAMDIAPRHLDRSGRVAIGVLFALADCAMSLASNANRTAVAVTTDLVRSVADGPPGPQVATATLDAAADPAAKAVTWRVVVDLDGETVALFTGTTLALDS